MSSFEIFSLHLSHQPCVWPRPDQAKPVQAAWRGSWCWCPSARLARGKTNEKRQTWPNPGLIPVIPGCQVPSILCPQQGEIERRNLCLFNVYTIYIVEGSLEVKLPTIWTDEKQGRGREKRKIRREKSRRERVRRKKMQMREKVGKSQDAVFFRCFVAPDGQSRLAKAAGAETLGRWEMKNGTPLWREADFEVKRYKTPGSRNTFGSWDVEKVHAVVVRSTFRSQNVQSTPFSDHFWKLRCRKSACRCGTKHMPKSKCTKHTILGPLLEVEMSKKCTPLWREAHVEVKMYKAPHVRATFGPSDVEKVHAVVARSTFRSQSVKSTRVSDHFWRFRCRFASLHYITLHSTTLHYSTLQYTTFHYTSLDYTTLHSTTLQLQLHNYTPLQYTTLH